jgi:hypothetical protein
VLRSFLLFAIAQSVVFAAITYDSIPTPLPPNVPSVGYEANSISELGNAVTLAPGSRRLISVTAVLSNWALESTYQPVGTSPGFEVPLTLNLYNYDAGGAVGSRFASMTIDGFVPWRPEADPACTGVDAGKWLATNGRCYSGIAAEVVFDFSGMGITLPDTLIFGLAFNTQHFGYTPTGVPGPYNSLNFGTFGSPSTGTNVYSDSIYTSTGGPLLLDAGGWEPYSPEVRIDVVPEPTALHLLGAGVLLLGIPILRRRR